MADNSETEKAHPGSVQPSGNYLLRSVDTPAKRNAVRAALKAGATAISSKTP